MTPKADGLVENGPNSVGELSSAAVTAEVSKAIPKFKQLPEKDRQMAVEIVMQQTQFSGPLPPPQILKGYEDVCPGAAQTILKMATDDLAHTHDMQQKAFSEDACRAKRNFWYKLLGLIFGFLTCLAFIGTAGLMAWLGHPIEGTILGGVSISAILSTFVLGTRKRHKNNNSEQQRQPAPKHRKR